MRAGDVWRPVGECVGSQRAAGGGEGCFKVPPSLASVWRYNRKWEQNKPPLRSGRWCVPSSLFVDIALVWLPFTFFFFYGWDPWNDSAEIRNCDDSIPASLRTDGSVFPSLLRGYFTGRHGWDEKCLIWPFSNLGFQRRAALVSTFHIQTVRLNQGEDRWVFFFNFPVFEKLLFTLSHIHLSSRHQI